MNLEYLDPEDEDSDDSDTDSGGQGGGANPIGDRGSQLGGGKSD